MEKTILTLVIAEFEELRTSLYLAKKTIDNRKRDKRIRDAKLSIAEYVHSIPDEVKAYLNSIVVENALSYKWIEEDLDRCINALKEWNETLPE